MVRQACHESPTTYEFFIGFIDSPGPPSPVHDAVLAVFEFGDRACYPAQDRRQRNSALGHPLHGIAKDGLEPEAPPPAATPVTKASGTLTRSGHCQT